MKLNFSYILATILVATLLPTQVFAAKGGKPPPEPVPAVDVDCNGCVDSIDIANGAVTTDELSPALQQQNSQLDARVTALENPVTEIGVDCRPLNLVSGADLRNCVLTGLQVTAGTDLSGANFSGADLRGAWMIEVILINADLSNTKLITARFDSADLTGANLENTDSAAVGTNPVNFTRAILTNANLTNANLTTADFDNADMSGANLTAANLINAQFINANLFNAILDDVITGNNRWWGATCIA